jgi:hypothetical protein
VVTDAINRSEEIMAQRKRSNGRCMVDCERRERFWR